MRSQSIALVAKLLHALEGFRMGKHWAGIALFAVFAAFAGTGFCAEPGAMKEYADKETGMAFSLPGEPKITTGTTKAGAHTYQYVLDKGGSAITINVTVNQEKVIEDAAAKVIPAVRDATVKSFKSKIVSQKPVTLEGHPGLEYKFEGSKYHGVYRIYVVEKRMVQLCSLAAKGTPLLPETDQVFESLHLVKP
jgi:hypothetical protein